MNFNKIEQNIIKNTVKTTSKNFSTESTNLDNVQNLLYGISKKVEEVQNFLKQNCNEYTDNAFKFENYVLIPEKNYLCEEMDRQVLKCDILDSKSVLRLKKTMPLEEDGKLYIFSIGDSTETPIKYNKNATDKAKIEFYQEMKRLIETGNVDINEILDNSLWYMNTDGSKIYNISSNITGQTIMSDREIACRNLFDKLFNKNK